MDFSTVAENAQDKPHSRQPVPGLRLIPLLLNVQLIILFPKPCSDGNSRFYYDLMQ
jgi:hypothetical protein